MKRSFVAVLSFVMPTLLFAQTVPGTPVIVSSYDLVAPTGVAHVEELEVNGKRRLHCVVTTNEGKAEVTYDGRTIRFGDGYFITRTTLSNTADALVGRLVATDPEGGSGTTIFGVNRKTGETTFAGVEQYTGTLRRSHDVRIANRVLPLVVPPPRVPHLTGSGTTLWMASGSPDPLATDVGNASVTPLMKAKSAALGKQPSFRPVPTSDCLSSALLFVAAAGLSVEVCLNGSLWGCVSALVGLAGAFEGVLTDCFPGFEYGDTTGYGP